MAMAFPTLIGGASLNPTKIGFRFQETEPDASV
jgi:hypothetical protein